MRLTGSKWWVTVGAATLFILSLLPVGTVLAGPVLSWDATATVEFDTGVTTFDPGTGGTTNTTSTIAWGTPTNSTGQNPGLEQSRLVIAGSPAMGTLLTGGPPTFGPTLTHENNVLAIGSAELDSFKVDVSITLVPTVGPPNHPAYGVIPPFNTPVVLSTSFTGDFEETLNHPADGNCLGGGTDGVGINDNGCADIFALVAGALSVKFDYPNPQPEGPPFITYVADLGVSGLVNLPDAACAALGLPNGCRGFLTREVADNSLIPALTIDIMRMPEPSTLSLLGLGILGLAAGIRLRRK